jgi:hypothetical protein
MEERLDKTIIKKQSRDDADRTVGYWMTKSPEERLIAAYHLSLRVYGYDPVNPPKMEKALITKRQRAESKVPKVEGLVTWLLWDTGLLFALCPLLYALCSSSFALALLPLPRVRSTHGHQ